MWRFVAYLIEPRAMLYEQAATLYSHAPSPETLVFIRKHLTEIEEQLDFWDDPSLVGAVRDVVSALDSVERIEDVHADYRRLLGARKGAVGHAHESAYREAMPHGTIAVDVCAAYASFGFQRASWFSGPADHVAMECLFMALMGRNFTALAEETGVNPSAYITHLERQHRFVSRHLVRWIPRWSDDMCRSADTRLYRSAATLTKMLVETDERRFADYVKLIQGCGYNNYAKDRSPANPRLEPCVTENRFS